MKTAFAIFSMLVVSTPAFAGEWGHPFRGPEHREAHVGREFARERAYERFRIGRFERGRFIAAHDCGRRWY
jgi:hypothetical protein